MTVTFTETATTVPIAGNQTVTIEPKQPWPSAYRGSRYSVRSAADYDEPVLTWKQRDLQLNTSVPKGLRRALVLAGKEGGAGSVRVTATGEVITKVKAEDYSNLEQAPVSEGWIPVYLGKLEGNLLFEGLDLDPTPPTETVRVWSGLPFNHGERWSVSHDGTLVWNWKDYRFKSAFSHQELVAAYRAYRPNPGRLYVTEHGHIWINVPFDDIVPEKAGEIKEAVTTWRTAAEQAGNASTLRLVNRRLVATSRDDDPATGYLPIHLGHLSAFDSGQVPKPVVDDEEYYLVVGQYEQVWE